ncbi:MAG: hypothetical protein ABIO55_15410 [Ginsengibacter sp.]
MNYKEENFKIDTNQISFKTNSIGLIGVAIIIPIFFIGGRVIVKDTTAVIWLLILSLAIILLLYRSFSSFTKVKILLADISKVEIKDAKSNTGKLIFRGTGQFRNYFPAGLNKKTSDKIFFISQKDKKVIIGFTPVNCAETIFTFKEKGISVIG